MIKYQKLSDYAKEKQVQYRTVWNKFKEGKIKNAFKDGDGKIWIKIDTINDNPRVALYSRVSSNDRNESLNNQLNKLLEYASNKQWEVTHSIKEIASGMNDNRKKLNKLLDYDDWDILLIENKERLTRFGFNYIEKLLNKQNKEIIVINEIIDDKQDLMNDLISIIYSFSARMHGLRRRKKREVIESFIDS